MQRRVRSNKRVQRSVRIGVHIKESAPLAAPLMRSVRQLTRGDDVNQTKGKPMNYLSRALLLAPFIFVAHFLEEAPQFVEWFNAHVARGINSALFWRVNISALVITILVVGIVWFFRSAFSLALAVGWLSFLMLANAIFHVTGGLVDKRYVPGLVTAIVLYIPYYCWVIMRVVKSKGVKVKVLVVAAVIGSLPMIIHGYLIIFRGERLF
jgi:hypothetical protein